MSASERYTAILKIYTEELEHPTLRQDSEEYQTLLTSTIQDLLSLKTIVYGKLALFSNNETLDDISTNSLKFLSIDYYLGTMCSKKQATAKQVGDPSSKNRMKVKFLEKSVQIIMQFLTMLQDYEILDTMLARKIDSFADAFKPKLEELYFQPSNSTDLSGAEMKRQQKIEMFQQTKMINNKLKELESRLKNKGDEDMDGQDNKDDELLRSLYVQKLKSLSYQSFNEIEQILYESELLNNFLQRAPNMEELDGNNATKDQPDSTGFTDKLETLNKPLLSKTGKILRNFTLIDQKTQLQNKVRGYGQYGPTMSVEEFLEKEWEEGRVLQGGENDTAEHKEDEDNERWQDEQTYKAREWDEFTEANPRGSGNTINRG
ncbi:hypothetical protein NCAS_0A12810 [Naumovozyma castellii]|uniref:TAP42 n=1 Tax=Naumovozyma castellii TaxID=27288 RepID=G0V8P0_NAUCA|nr:hypothetical protein NCAS_0A12810 [Naumovozyma castellii CBS 4309]CCC67839.1 hypothetical protein NCAS_0A12810 [Naumovozyma castellii CBS 4309]